MQVTTEARSVASTARRSQIVAATVEVIAEEGLAQASFARIAERAGLSSTRLISYHFANKDELIDAVVRAVLGAMAAFVGERIDAAETTAETPTETPTETATETPAETPAETATGVGNATAILRAYVEGNVAFIDSHRSHMQALVQIVLRSAGLPPTATRPAAESPLEGLLRHGQTTGEFRDFDVASVGSAIQRAIEGLPFMLVARPDLDCDLYAAELVELYLRGVRKDAA